jgi:hypothetical protein
MSFAAAPALSRVEPVSNSGPVSGAITLSGKQLIRCAGLKVSSRTVAPRVFASSEQLQINGAGTGIFDHPLGRPPEHRYRDFVLPIRRRTKNRDSHASQLGFRRLKRPLDEIRGIVPIRSGMAAKRFRMPRKCCSNEVPVISRRLAGPQVKRVNSSSSSLTNSTVVRVPPASLGLEKSVLVRRKAPSYLNAEETKRGSNSFNSGTFDGLLVHSPVASFRHHRCLRFLCASSRQMFGITNPQETKNNSHALSAGGYCNLSEHHAGCCFGPIKRPLPIYTTTNHLNSGCCVADHFP